MHLSDVESFEKSLVWKDIVAVLREVRTNLMETDFLSTDPTNVARMGNIQGRVAMIDFILKQPDAIRVEVEAEQQNEKGR